MLLYIVVLLISQIRSEELKNNKIEEAGVKYAGPIIYSNEPPPVVYFPTPPTTESNEKETERPNVTLNNNNNVEYVPFPYQELPILIYKSKENPPIHVVPDSLQPNNLNNLTHFDKRFGDIANSGVQRASRALKSWSQFKLFNDIPLIMKAPKWTNSDNNGMNLISGQIIDFNNASLLNGAHNQISLANAPHVVYSGHPPIHVFPQPIIIKEPHLNTDMAEMTSASETFHTALKNAQTHNNLDPLLAAASNNHEVSVNPSSSSVYSYGGAPAGTGQSYGFRVKTRGNKHDTEYSSSQNHENYDDSYSQSQQSQNSDVSSDSQSDDNIGYNRPSNSFGNSIESNNENYEKDYDQRIRYPETFPKEKPPKYQKYNSHNWIDWDQDNGWLSSLFGYTRWPSRHRRPFAPIMDNFAYAASPTNQLDMESLALLNPQLRNPGWLTGFGSFRPAATAIRPVYSPSSLFGYRRPPISPPTSYFSRFTPGLAHAGSSLAQVAMKPYGFGPSMLGLPSFTYPMRVPYSPFMMYGYRRPPIGYGNAHPSGDLAFAESNRKSNTTKANQNKAGNNNEDIQTSASHVKPTFVLPSATPKASLLQNKPPIIIYQGLRPPVHLYQQPDAKSKPSFDSEKISMTAFQEMQEIKNQIQEQNIASSTTTTTTTTTESPYQQFYSAQDTKVNSGDEGMDFRYKPSTNYYTSHGTAFSPRHNSADDWIPVKKTVSESNRIEKKSDSDYQS
jgi:hypothetical protein